MFAPKIANRFGFRVCAWALLEASHKRSKTVDEEALDVAMTPPSHCRLQDTQSCPLLAQVVRERAFASIVLGQAGRFVPLV